jgi:hypothetical protein
MAKSDQPACDKNVEDAFAPKGGITNGARWYSLKGGMQVDYVYCDIGKCWVLLGLQLLGYEFV